MLKYKVFVPIESVITETLSSKSTTKLSENFVLAGIDFSEIAEKGIHIAKIELEALKQSDAEIHAVKQIEEIINLFAVFNDGFRVVISGVKSEKVEGKEQEVKVEKVKKEGNLLEIKVHDIVEMKEHCSVEKIKRNYKFEENALKWHAQWYDWLKLALRLNYLAVVSKNVVPSLILRYSALETITENLLGRQESLLKAKFSEKKRTILINATEKIFKCAGLEGNEVRRLIQRIQDAHEEGKSKRIQDALQRCKVNAQTQDVNFVSKMRGKAIHPIRSSDINDLKKAASNIETWTRESLQFLLSNPSFFCKENE